MMKCKKMGVAYDFVHKTFFGYYLKLSETYFTKKKLGNIAVGVYYSIR